MLNLDPKCGCTVALPLGFEVWLTTWKHASHPYGSSFQIWLYYVKRWGRKQRLPKIRERWGPPLETGMWKHTPFHTRYM